MIMDGSVRIVHTANSGDRGRVRRTTKGIVGLASIAVFITAGNAAQGPCQHLEGCQLCHSILKLPRTLCMSIVHGLVHVECYYY